MIKPRSDLVPNTADYENLPLVTPNGFREYDARWLFGKEINLLGIQALGLGSAVVGGHSLGGTVVTAYATWDFDGRAGAADLAGLVFIDGGSRTGSPSAQEATRTLQELNAPTVGPWLTFGNIPAPFAGLYNASGSAAALLDHPGELLGAVHIRVMAPPGGHARCQRSA